MRQQRASVAFPQPQAPQISPRHQHLNQQLPRRQRNCLPVVQFLQHDSIAAAFKARKYLFQESHRLQQIINLLTASSLRRRHS
jgi:hypothetical protein